MCLTSSWSQVTTSPSSVCSLVQPLFQPPSPNPGCSPPLLLLTPSSCWSLMTSSRQELDNRQGSLWLPRAGRITVQLRKTGPNKLRLLLSGCDSSWSPRARLDLPSDCQERALAGGRVLAERWVTPFDCREPSTTPSPIAKYQTWHSLFAKIRTRRLSLN